MVGALLPVFTKRDAELHTVVEKVHPSSVNFGTERFLAGIDELRKSVEVTVMLLVRLPSEAVASFLAYQERAAWHTDVESEHVPALYLESLKMMTEVRDRYDNTFVLDYSALRSAPVSAVCEMAPHVLGSTVEPGQIDDVVRRLDARASERSEDGFFGAVTSKAGLGPGRLGIGLSPLIAEASELYINLTGGDRTLRSEQHTGGA